MKSKESVQIEAMDNKPSYKKGSTGPIIGYLQRTLGIDDDENFGKDTLQSVRKVERDAGFAETGEAGERVFSVIGLQWPDHFLRCMNFTSALEGTSYGDVNRRDDDGAGVTLGIVGFTSSNGEVQQLVSAQLRRQSDAANSLSILRQDQLRKLILQHPAGGNLSAAMWKEFCYDKGGVIRDDFSAMLGAWALDDGWRKLQEWYAKEVYWTRAVKDADGLGLTTMLGLGLMYDTAVQNGGWRSDHMKQFQQESKDGTEISVRMAVARSVAACARPQYRKDVLSRKECFVFSAGFCHGSYYDLINFAFDVTDVK